MALPADCHAAAARLARAAALLAVVSCGNGAERPPPDLPAVGAQVSLLRTPREGGIILAYHPDSLAPSGWRSQQPVPAVRRVLGVDLEERLLWLLDGKGNLLAVDLETRGIRKVAEGATAGVLAADGTVYLTDTTRRIVRVSRRLPVRYQRPLPAPPRTMFGAVNDHLVILTAGPPYRMITASAEQEIQTTEIPRGEIAATVWGDLVAIAGDTALVLFETAGQQSRSELESGKGARRLGFSPSGHRLYLSRDEPRIQVFDRFSLDELAPVELPEPPRDFRIDASGRWLLARPPTQDSVWVVDLATGKLASTLPSGWSSDLPLVAGAATLIGRQGDDVVAFDLRQGGTAPLATLEGGAADLWTAAAWVPPERVPAAVAAAESATVVQDSALASRPPVAPADSTMLYLQVSRTQNPDWADLLVRQLKSEGYPAAVLKPVEPEDGYRVVVGPFGSREEADSAGRLLGRAYFVLRLPSQRP